LISTELRVDSLVIDFGLGGTESPHLLGGWSGPEVGHRWAIGGESALRVPPLYGSRDVLLTLMAIGVPLEGTIQRIAISINGNFVSDVQLLGPFECAVVIRRRLMRLDRENIIRFFYRHSAEPGQLSPKETRRLAVAFKRIKLEPVYFQAYAEPRFLPKPTLPHSAESLLALGKQFQSLGQNCEFGLVQRRLGAEPMGLLRFASISLDKLLVGVQSQFAGIDSPELLKMELTAPGGEYMIRHQTYGLDYHTFYKEGQIDPATLLGREPMRLRLLARLLLEEIQTAYRAFVVQRADPPLTLQQVLPLYQALRRHNPDVRLLFVVPLGVEYSSLVGRVQRLAAGLFQGYVRRLAPGDNAHDLDLSPWIQVCATVAAAPV
jgi:hypothetical protein